MSFSARLPVAHNHAIGIAASNFADGSLHQDSSVRPDRLFTADSGLILYRAGGLSAIKVQEVVARIVALITAWQSVPVLCQARGSSNLATLFTALSSRIAQLCCIYSALILLYASPMRSTRDTCR